MDWFLALPIIIGIMGILQGGINRWVAADLGITHMSLITNVLGTFLCLSLIVAVKARPLLFSDIFQFKTEITSFKWWYILPPILGFFIIIGFPVAIMKLGAVKVTVGLIAAQMFTSVIWDIFVENISMGPMKVAGIVLALASVLCISLSKTI